MSGQPKRTALGLPDLPDQPNVPRDIEEEQEERLKSFFEPEQWAWICWLTVSLVLTGCGGNFHKVQFSAVPMVQYESWTEKGFCMTSTGAVHNVLQGGPISSPMPLCNRADIVMHTHPAWCERTANFIDYASWTEYHKRYGNWQFGVMGRDWIEVYEVN